MAVDILGPEGKAVCAVAETHIIGYKAEYVRIISHKRVFSYKYKQFPPSLPIFVCMNEAERQTFLAQ
jgi:hypothetical protein